MLPDHVQIADAHILDHRARPHDRQHDLAVHQDATSTAPAFSGWANFFISGMVKVPVVTVFAMDDQDEAVMAEDTTAALAARRVVAEQREGDLDEVVPGTRLVEVAEKHKEEDHRRGHAKRCQTPSVCIQKCHMAFP